MIDKKSITMVATVAGILTAAVSIGGAMITSVGTNAVYRERVDKLEQRADNSDHQTRNTLAVLIRIAQKLNVPIDDLVR